MRSHPGRQDGQPHLPLFRLVITATMAATRGGDDGDGGGGGARSSSGALSSLWLDYARDGPDRDWAVTFRTPPVHCVVATALGLGGFTETGSPGSWSLRQVYQATGACSCVERVWQCTRRARPIRVRAPRCQPTHSVQRSHLARRVHSVQGNAADIAAVTAYRTASVSRADMETLRPTCGGLGPGNCDGSSVTVGLRNSPHLLEHLCPPHCGIVCCLCATCGPVHSMKGGFVVTCGSTYNQTVWNK